MHQKYVVQAATDVCEVRVARDKQVTSENEGTLKCRGENRDPYILSKVVCAHMVHAPQYCMYMYL